MAESWIVLTVFAAVYAGMALGRWPGLAIDRTGVALIGAIVLVASGAVSPAAALAYVDLPTLAILFALMVVTAQFAASNVFDRITAALASDRAPPRRILLGVVLVGGGLASVLTNDVVVWAMVPLLVRGLARRGIDPRPHVIALACAANAGSAATLIGNPQNLLIGQAGQLAFWPFVAVCAVPAIAALAIVYAVAARLGGQRLDRSSTVAPAPPAQVPPTEAAAIDRFALAKGIAAAAGIILVFSLTADRAVWALAVAGALLLSRRLTTREMLGLVDWNLLLLFAGLFIVTGALGHSGTVERLLASLGGPGAVGHADPLLLVALAGSNTIGNVPLVVLVLGTVPGLGPADLWALAIFSTLAGNLLIVGSMANIIAAQQAAAAGVRIGFLDYARIGVPVTLASLAIAWAWMRFAVPPLATWLLP